MKKQEIRHKFGSLEATEKWSCCHLKPVLSLIGSSSQAKDIKIVTRPSSKYKLGMAKPFLNVTCVKFHFAKLVPSNSFSNCKLQMSSSVLGYVSIFLLLSVHCSRSKCPRGLRWSGCVPADRPGIFPDNEATKVATLIFERWTVSHAVIVPRAHTNGPQNPIERFLNPNDPFEIPSKKEREG